MNDSTTNLAAGDNAQRFHALDALRAGMMLLGIVLHASCCYTVVAIPLVPHHDVATSPLFDGLCRFLHTFRLPAFFVLAGFFAALLLDRHGPAGMLRNRWKRLILPLLFGWPILAPLTILALVFALQRHPAFLPGEVTREIVVRGAGATERDGFLLHLWFLYDLFLLCLLAAAGHSFLHRFLPKFPRLIAQFFRRVLDRGNCHACLIILPLATSITLFPMKTGTFDTSAWVLPPIRILAAYGIFFAFGWLLFGERDRLHIFLPGAWQKTLAGLILFLPHQAGLKILNERSFQPGEPVHLVTVLSGSLACWLLIFGLLGICLRHFGSPHPWIRYLTNASYFLYLAHLPLVLFFQGILAPIQMPAILKFSIVTILTTTTLLALYDCRVRNSRLSQWLNGRRYPRVRLRPVP